jgi:hypothetical protein
LLQYADVIAKLRLMTWRSPDAQADRSINLSTLLILDRVLRSQRSAHPGAWYYKDPHWLRWMARATEITWRFDRDV